MTDKKPLAKIEIIHHTDNTQKIFVYGAFDNLFALLVMGTLKILDKIKPQGTRKDQMLEIFIKCLNEFVNNDNFGDETTVDFSQFLNKKE